MVHLIDISGDDARSAWTKAVQTAEIGHDLGDPLVALGQKGNVGFVTTLGHVTLRSDGVVERLLDFDAPAGRDEFLELTRYRDCREIQRVARSAEWFE